MIKRHITNKILESLTDTPVVFLQGARQVGKSTLVQALSKAGHESEYLTLDDATMRRVAGFASVGGRMVDGWMEEWRTSSSPHIVDA